MALIEEPPGICQTRIEGFMRLRRLSIDDNPGPSRGSSRAEGFPFMTGHRSGRSAERKCADAVNSN